MGVRFRFVLSLSLVAILAFLAGAFSFRSSSASDFLIPRPHDLKAVAPGCTLVSPSRMDDGQNGSLRKSVFLVNNHGKTVHTWSFRNSIDNAFLDRDGNLWASVVDTYNLKGRAPSIQKLSWDGALLNEYSLQGMTHDFTITDDGSTIITEMQSPLPEDRSPPSFQKAKVVVVDQPWQTQSLIEVETKTGKVLRSYDLLKIFPRHLKEPNPMQLETRELFHINSVQYLLTNPINRRPAFLVSIRNLSMIALIDRESGQSIWEYQPHPNYFMHDASLLSNGDLLVFVNDNAFATGAFSSVEQIDLKTKKSVWFYRSMRRKNFHSSAQGGAQRLANGNTLITNALSGHVFEITPEAQVVWEMMNNQITNERDHAWPFAAIFRATKYNEHEVDWKKLGVDCF